MKRVCNGCTLAAPWRGLFAGVAVKEVPVAAESLVKCGVLVVIPLRSLYYMRQLMQMKDLWLTLVPTWFVVAYNQYSEYSESYREQYDWQSLQRVLPQHGLHRSSVRAHFVHYTRKQCFPPLFRDTLCCSLPRLSTGGLLAAAAIRSDPNRSHVERQKLKDQDQFGPIPLAGAIQVLNTSAACCVVGAFVVLPPKYNSVVVVHLGPRTARSTQHFVLFEVFGVR